MKVDLVYLARDILYAVKLLFSYEKLEISKSENTGKIRMKDIRHRIITLRGPKACDIYYALLVGLPKKNYFLFLRKSF
jgi:hypothetical protein